MVPDLHTLWTPRSVAKSTLLWISWEPYLACFFPVHMPPIEDNFPNNEEGSFFSASFIEYLLNGGIEPYSQNQKTHFRLNSYLTKGHASNQASGKTCSSIHDLA